MNEIRFYDKFEIEKFPCWALCYVVNGDASYLEDADIEMVDKYLERLARDLKWESVDNIMFADEDVENYDFCAFPEFGLACECCKVIAFGFKIND